MSKHMDNQAQTSPNNPGPPGKDVDLFHVTRWGVGRNPTLATPSLHVHLHACQDDGAYRLDVPACVIDLSWDRQTIVEMAKKILREFGN